MKKSDIIFIVGVSILVTFYFSIWFVFLTNKHQHPYVILPKEMPVGSIGDIMYVSRNDKDTVEFLYIDADTTWQIKH